MSTPDKPRESSTVELQAAIAAAASAVEAELDRLLPPVTSPATLVRLREAVRYATLSGGKRLRPFLLLETSGLMKVPRERALRAAAALEMVHCYSLVHDDLPAMDDSPLRRGQATLHVAYDEATAILVGDALLTEAFKVLAEPATHPDAAIRCDLVVGLSLAAGEAGMVGGQAIDLSPDRAQLDLKRIEELQALKTGALISEACRAGAVLGGAPQDHLEALEGYSQRLGLIFQITDDLLDFEGDAQAIGKPAGQDATQGKATFVGMLGAEAARAEAEELGKIALECLDIFDNRADFLRKAVDYVLKRRN